MNTRLTRSTMVAAMRNDDARYDGRFFVCVTTTRIFCLPSCKAKLPNLENVRFVRSKGEAKDAGFRGCKRCRAESFPDVRPAWFTKLLLHLRRNPRTKVNEGELASLAGVDISTVRRTFRAVLHTTPTAFHRRIRLAHARELLERGADIITAGMESGFESASGFREAYLREFGRVPGNRRGR
jgi:AraC family transcriptional regulator of adaptative response/methylated-DNA-[protein]-cysteine methyltransferase